MRLINALNVNSALSQGINMLKMHGLLETSRNGDVLRMPQPVTTIYHRPNERVLFAEWRDANPFFHLIEALWMLAGRDDLKQLTPYVKRMAEFSDDGGITQPGAYGKRWRDWFMDVGDEGGHFLNFDQLNWVVRRLMKDPNDRRTVIQMWDASSDPHTADAGGKDVPCNVTALPWVCDGALHLTVFCRSNDIIWGAYGANAVHFSFLLEYLAARLRLHVGTLTQVSNNFHAYLATLPEPDVVIDDEQADWYLWKNLVSYPLFTDFYDYSQDSDRERIMQEDLRIFFEHGAKEAATKARWPYLRRVAVPMALAHEHWRKTKGEARFTGALEILDQVQAQDWRIAAKGWIERRYNKWQRAADDGVSG